MASEQTYEPYYVPHNSALPIFASMGLFLLILGFGSTLNALKAEEAVTTGTFILLSGMLVLFTTLFFWFSKVIDENSKKLYSQQMRQSYVWAMGWFIFSEVMFFIAFFGALFYVRVFVVDWIGGVGDRGPSDMLWPDYVPAWPLVENPDNVKFPGADQPMGAFGLPLINTILLVTSSWTVNVAHHGIKEGNRSKFVNWLGLTVALGVAFLICQAYEYYHAYVDLGLTLNAGIYGTTFFMLTGFHGAHVTLGTFMLLVMFLRARKGHFDKDDCFGFEATSWYWHFVDVVWIGLFVFVYILADPWVLNIF